MIYFTKSHMLMPLRTMSPTFFLLIWFITKNIPLKGLQPFSSAAVLVSKEHKWAVTAFAWDVSGV